MSISRIALSLHFVPKFEPDAVIGQKRALRKGLKLKMAVVLTSESKLREDVSDNRKRRYLIGDKGGNKDKENGAETKRRKIETKGKK